MSGVEDASIKVRAYCPSICTKKLILTFDGGVYYQLEFRIKDGRVRVSAPYIEDTVTFNSVPPQTDSFRKIVSKWYKKGELKKGDVMKHKEAMLQMNGIINRILHTSAVQDAQDDW